MAEAAAIAAINFVKAAASYIAGATLTTAQAAAIINTITYTVASVGLNAYLSSQREFPNQGRALQLGIAPDLPRRWQVGRRANAGILVDWHVKGHKNQFLYMVVYLAEGPNAPINEIIADGRSVWTGTLNHGQSVRLTEFDSPDERARVYYHDGRVGQTVPAILQTEFGLPATYRGTGCAHVILSLHWDPDTTPTPPGMSYVSDGGHFYDRRLDGTQGGSGSHRLTDPSTWAPTKTPAVALDHYLLGNYWPGMSKPRLGVGLDYADVPYDRFAALANLCEENEASTYFGSQQRYEANGFIEANQVHADIITELCKAMDARPADFGGKVSAISHDAKTSIMTITDDDLYEVGSELYDPKRSWGQLVGGAQGTYQDPANNFQPAEYPPVEDSAWEVEDGGETKRVSYPLPYETNSTRAQRLARLFVNRERRQATLGGLYAPRVIELEEGDWYTRQGADFPAGKLFEVVEPPRLNPQTLGVTMSGLEVDPTDSGWDTADEVAPDPGTGDTNNSPPALPVPVVTFSTFSYGFGQYSFESVQFNHTEFAEAPLDIDVELTGSDGSAGPEAGDRVVALRIAAGQQFANYNALLPGKQYVVRVRARAGTRRSAWSAYTEFTAGTNGQYGPIGGTGATLGTDVYREDGLTVVGDNDAITGLGIAAGFTGQGGLSLLNNFGWGSGLLTGIPGELNDGRITAGLDSLGDLNRNIPASRLNTSNVLRYTSGGLFTGLLNADYTPNAISAGFVGQGSLASLSSISASNANLWNLMRYTSGGLFTGDLNADVTSGNIAAGFTGQGALASLNQVDTPEIADNAVSDGDEDTQSNYDFTAIDNTFVTLCTLAPQNVGGVAILSWNQSWVMSAFGGGTANTEIGTVDTEIRRDGVMIFENSEPYTNRNTGTFGDSGGWTDSDFDLVVDTNAVYTLAVRVSVTSAWSPGSPSIESRSVSATLKATAFAK